MKLDYLNKNWYRNYPLRATSSYKSTEGADIPQSLLASLKLTTTLGNHDAFISKIFVLNNYINITISHYINASNTKTLGYAAAIITSNNQTLEIIPTQDFVSGFVVIGEQSALSSLNGGYLLDYTNGKIEDSLVTCIKPPAVTALVRDTQKATGHASFDLTNISKVDPFAFGIIDVSVILSNNDASAKALNCPTNVIKGINNVLPNAQGNIDIYAIDPISLTVSNGLIKFDSTLTTKDICANVYKNIPPDLKELFPGLDESSLNEYKGYLADGNLEKSPLTTDTPEWKDIWPQHQ